MEPRPAMKRNLDDSLVGLGIFAAAILGVIAARLVGHFALEDVPHVMDEIAYLLQARTFAGGHLTAPLHLPRAAFAMWFVDDRVRTFSIFPPGWPAVLALGLRTGLAAWVSPVLHGLTALLVAFAGGRLGGRRAAVLAAVLYALSPQAVLLAGSFMSHTLVALTAAVVLAAGLRLVQPGSTWRCAAAAGAAVGLAAVTRPLCGIVLGLAAALFAGLAIHRRAFRPAHLAALAAPMVLSAVLLGVYNNHLTGSPLRFPQDAFFDQHAPPIDLPLFTYHPGCNRLGFGPGHGCEALPEGAHTVANALRNTGRNLTAWLWLAGGGPLAFALLFFAFRGDGERGPRAVVLAVVPVTIVLYGLYWYAGTCYGARFYHAALPALLLLAALGLAGIARRRLAAVALGAVLLWNVAIGGLATAEVSHLYWGTDGRFARLAASWHEPPALILVAFADGGFYGHYRLTTFLHDVSWAPNIRALGALGVNRPDLGGPVVFARYHPGLMSELRARFPERKPWLYILGSLGADTPDLLMPYDSTGLAALEAGAERPRDNFDGFVVTPRSRNGTSPLRPGS
jgi:4-amino-4-deoxy-L-arabinose transferase-like glycosyltransferase